MTSRGLTQISLRWDPYGLGWNEYGIWKVKHICKVCTYRDGLYIQDIYGPNFLSCSASILSTALGVDHNKDSLPVKVVDAPNLLLFLPETIVQILRLNIKGAPRVHLIKLWLQYWSTWNRPLVFLDYCFSDLNGFQRKNLFIEFQTEFDYLIKIISSDI